ncbi:hypothetical protein MTY66_63320 (plasmid) [Mycolicibacterium sp. TY66]|uniref:hypothetical protein n=1 Tax=Mycobacteriaceae TaxID=1762 RepID=UPI0013F4CDFB|nr:MULTISPECIES: hypothetical protein [Mycobacteriaceae]BCI84707.1 hypothetical protein MTY66_63320 [Mycolicibacterium sp. TY66]BCJ84936.1 hypothetical protein MTY81_63090 [Mycolicibacterium sp. TY81]
MGLLSIAVQGPAQLLGGPLAGIDAGAGDRIADRADVATVQAVTPGDELSGQFLD